MPRELQSIVSDVLDGTTEKRVYALKDFVKQFDEVIAAAAAAVAVMVPADSAWLVAERVVQFAYAVQKSFHPVFETATDEHRKVECGLVLLHFGSREALPWLLTVASTPGPQQHPVTCQLAKLGVTEVRGAMLEQLRTGPLNETGTIKDGGELSDLLELWKKTGELLPEDVLTRMRGEDAPLYVKSTMKSLGWS